MPRFPLALVFLGLIASSPLAQPYSVELDFDGTLGNGPDMVNAQPGDTLAVDVWCTGTGNPFVGIHITLCANPEILAFDTLEYGFDSCWIMLPPEYLGDGCQPKGFSRDQR